MKIRINPFLRSVAFAPAFALITSSLVHAVECDTTGNTIGTPTVLTAGDT